MMFTHMVPRKDSKAQSKGTNTREKISSSFAVMLGDLQ